MILALAGQFKQLSHEPEKFRWLNGIRTHDLCKYNTSFIYDYVGLISCDPPSFPVIFSHNPPFWRAKKDATLLCFPPPQPPPPPHNYANFRQVPNIIWAFVFSLQLIS